MSRAVFMGRGHFGDAIAKVIADAKLNDVVAVQNEQELTAAAGNAQILVLALPNCRETVDLLQGIDGLELQGKAVINYAPTTVAQVLELEKLVKGKGARLLSAAVICHRDAIGTEDSYIVYSGDQQAYTEAQTLINALKGAHNEGENIVEASLMDFTANGVHYSYLLAFYTGVAMCKKYGFPLETYLYHTLKSLPPLSEAAYRNIWIGLDDPRSFEEIDDVIHGMEMLVCLLKKSGGKEEIRSNTDRQKAVNDILYQHWNDLMNDYSKLQG